ncbi:outer membrane protein assembly factor BamE [Ahrensia sp. 13_GOM-1096m]|uniref:outer membrane protein assembly factor BamE n=1 Tax=Ahrensia sp. 13_GOM-1096m TaxID=1380380 RepID=UPI0005579547
MRTLLKEIDVAAKNSKTDKRGHFIAAAVAVAMLGVSGCSTSSVLGSKETFKQGYVIDEETMALAPVGSSREQVLLALGTPTTTNNFGGEVFYYISQTRVRSAQFLKPKLVDQRVFAIYFDDSDTVSRIADYGLKDGRVFDFVAGATPTGGKDQTFLGQILTGSLGGPSASSILGR